MDLPDAIVEHRLAPFLTWSDLLALEDTSRRWKELVGRSRSWETLAFRHESDAKTATVVTRIAGRHGRRVRSFSLTDCAVSDATLIAVAKLLCSLRVVNLSGCHELSDAGVVALVETSAETLVSFRACRCSQLTDVSLTALVRGHAKSVQHVDFSHCRLISRDGVAELARSCSSLRALVMTGCPAINSAAVEIIATSCGPLETLLIGRTASISDDALKSLGDHCTRLRSLDIARSNPFGTSRDGVSDDALAYLSSRCRQLEHIGLGGQGRLTLAAVVSLWSHCPNLMRLDLSGCPAVVSNTVNLIAVLKQMAALQQLNLSFSGGVSQEDAALFRTHCAQVQIVNVSGPRWITKAA